MSEFRRRLMAVKNEELKENEVLTIYNVTTTESETRLLGNSFNLSNITKMKIDGVDVTPTKVHTFTQTGEHTVKLKITDNLTNMGSMFHGCASLVSFDLSKLDTSKVTSMESTFRECRSLVYADLSKLNTGSLTSLSNVFLFCSSLKSVDLSNFDTRNVTAMNSMFNECSSLLSIDLSSFDTKKVGSFSHTFYLCRSLTSLDLSNFDVSSVWSFSNVFLRCDKITHLEPFYNWKTSDIYLASSPISAENVHNLILRSLGPSNGATARTLTLHATTKTNWQNSEYYNADQAMATEKLITIK